MTDNFQVNWRSRIVKSGKILASQLTPHPNNPKYHPPSQREAIATSIDTYGQVAPVVVNLNNGYLVDGHERGWLAIAQKEDIEVDAIWVDITEQEHLQLLALYDHIGHMAGYEPELLDTLLQQVNSDSEVIQRMLSELAEGVGLYLDDGNATPEGDPNAVLDRATELREKYGVERGQLWTIGRHRLMCGDAYHDVEVLLNGATPDMLHIDPPYGINIVKPSKRESSAADGGAKPFGATADTTRKGAKAVAFRNGLDRVERGHVQHGKPSKNQWAKNHPEYMTIQGDTGATSRARSSDKNGLLSHDVGRGNPARTGMIKPHQVVAGLSSAKKRNEVIQSNIYPVIEGDDRPFDPSHFLDHAPIVIMWGANYFATQLPTSSCWICWDKREDITRNNFADGELAWTNMDKPMRIFHHLWNGLHKGSQHGERRTHPTEKPVALFEEIGKMFCPDGLWLDLFAGTGAQLVAAERVGTTCYAMEIEPLYVACILERMSDMGLKPERVS